MIFIEMEALNSKKTHSPTLQKRSRSLSESEIITQSSNPQYCHLKMGRPLRSPVRNARRDSNPLWENAVDSAEISQNNSIIDRHDFPSSRARAIQICNLLTTPIVKSPSTSEGVILFHFRRLRRVRVFF